MSDGNIADFQISAVPGGGTAFVTTLATGEADLLPERERRRAVGAGEAVAGRAGGGEEALDDPTSGPALRRPA